MGPKAAELPPPNKQSALGGKKRIELKNSGLPVAVRRSPPRKNENLHAAASLLHAAPSACALRLHSNPPKGALRER